MILESVWNQYRERGYAGVCDAAPTNPLARFYLALIAFAENDLERAAVHAQAAASQSPADPVFAQGATYLKRVLAQGKAAVYVDGTAFAAFIRGGGNVGLYAATHRALRAVYDEYRALSVLDIGVGDGLALLPALTPAMTRLDVIEPSGAMLEHTISQLRAQNVPHRAYNTTLQAFTQTEAGHTGHWDVIQATWSLQSIPPEERSPLFAWMRAHGERVVIAEFDVPSWTLSLVPARVEYIVSRYINGLREYEDDQDVVAQGFLMPVMFGYFDRSAARTNWEGPITEWRDGLRAAGFTQITLRPLTAYFWADSYIVDVR